MSDEVKAKEFLDKAEKRVKGSSFMSFFSGGSGAKFEESASDFTKAANLYKMAKKWDQAGAAFQRAAECYLKANSKHDAASSYVSAANCYKKGNVADAVITLKAAIEYYTDEGRFSIAAKHQKEIAELYEAEGDLEQANASYQIAADFFEGENSTVAAHQCLLKIALFSAQLERYDKAIEIYERVASASLDNNLTQYGCKEYFFKACLCYLASDDLVSGERALQRYKDMQASFSATREARLLDDIIQACRQNNVENFTNAVYDFNTISPLDSWKTSMLLKVKSTINKDAESVV
ncbi:soluble NSF attachment protein alpha isoform [Heterostelium album PN500]|uniref:Soluble NSF attachment protein alpha isoform n=1 Tax=Heterostelium pallidum (strain ATCC 26659 / Pp 5 / PN500) TaxID=670386 RepID=D3BNG5_HETP5|nr:soluble NSF attachment protein alpha isoform [Heterostelium album PN500]EFA76916.1 soluble NSF attachment protein alpha isoform [Heterostelium album PN500]|eukprot:XP_020429048.1 soluble NSF attachment protein alpha isoform [Heterostelium album PN500]